MSTLVKVELGMVVGAVVGFVVLALIGKWLQVKGIARDQADMGRITFPFLMGLFVVFAFGLIGVGLHLFIAGQGGIGNSEVGMVAFLRRNETGVILGFWAFLALGFGVAYPFMKRDMVGPVAAKGAATDGGGVGAGGEHSGEK